LFWIGLMEHFPKDAAARQLQRSADYELAVAHLRGKGDLMGEFGLVRDYFADVEDWLAVADLQDAATLLVYARKASPRLPSSVQCARVSVSPNRCPIAPLSRGLCVVLAFGSLRCFPRFLDRPLPSPVLFPPCCSSSR
jgi:hypothetical protein